MRPGKTIIVVLTLAAVAGRPTFAALQPCCCIKRVEVERPCCATKQGAEKHAAELCETPGTTVAAPRSCCSQKTPVATVVEASGCCCVQAPPAVPASRDQAKQVSEQAPLVPVLAAVDLFNAAPAARCVAHVSELRPLSGPPLLALYCIWRK